MTPLVHARSLAEFEHRDQLYGDKPYMYHIEGVVANARALQAVIGHMLPTVDWEDVLIVAYLHDIVEDTDMTCAKLLALGYSSEVVTAVDHITKRSGETRSEYLKRCMTDILALIGKYADTQFNLAESTAENHEYRMAKYTRQLEMIEMEIKTYDRS